MVQREELLVFHRSLEDCSDPQADLSLRLLSAGDLDSLELPVSHRQRIARALNSGDACYALIDHDRVVHHSMVSTKGRYRRPVAAELVCPGGIYIYDCWTHQGSRGKGMYRTVLERLCALNSDKERYALIDVWATNFPSVRGIQNAGFRLVGAFTVWRACRFAVISTPVELRPFLISRRPVRVQLHREGVAETDL